MRFRQSSKTVWGEADILFSAIPRSGVTFNQPLFLKAIKLGA